MAYKHSGKPTFGHARRKPKTSTFVKYNLILLDLLLIFALVFFIWHHHQENAQPVQPEKTTSQQLEAASDQANPKEETQTDTTEIQWVQQDQPVQLPILMYHSVHVMDPSEAANANLIVAPDVFESHLKALKEAGYYAVSPEEAYKILTENVLPKDQKAVWITFDDGVQDFYSIVYPLLKQYQLKATNNIITDFVANQYPSTLNLAQMQEMKENGMSFEDHTSTHPNLTTLANDAVVGELANSKQFLDSQLNQDTMTVAYPSGRYNLATTQIAASLGYQLGLTTENGLASASDGLLSLKRVRVNPTTTADSLLVEIATTP